MHRIGREDFLRLCVGITGMIEPKDLAFFAAGADEQPALIVERKGENIHVVAELGDGRDGFSFDRQEHALRAGPGVDGAIGAFGEAVNRTDARVFAHERLHAAGEFQIAKVCRHDAVEGALLPIGFALLSPMRCADGEADPRKEESQHEDRCGERGGYFRSNLHSDLLGKLRDQGLKEREISHRWGTDEHR